jgi:Protein phosphatase 2C
VFVHVPTHSLLHLFTITHTHCSPTKSCHPHAPKQKQKHIHTHTYIHTQDLDDFAFLLATPLSVYKPRAKRPVCRLRGDVLCELSSNTWNEDKPTKVVAAKTVSTYPIIDREARIRAGEPNCDAFRFHLFRNGALFAVADGAGWGERSSEAAELTVSTVIQYIEVGGMREREKERERERTHESIEAGNRERESKESREREREQREHREHREQREDHQYHTYHTYHIH